MYVTTCHKFMKSASRNVYTELCVQSKSKSKYLEKLQLLMSKPAQIENKNLIPIKIIFKKFCKRTNPRGGSLNCFYDIWALLLGVEWGGGEDHPKAHDLHTIDAP